MRKRKSRKKCTLKLKIIQIIFWNGKIHLNATEWNVVWMTYDTFHWYLARIEAARVCVHVWNISGYYVQLIEMQTPHMDHMILMGRWNCVTEISEPFRCDTIRHGVDVLAFFPAWSIHTRTDIFQNNVALSFHVTLDERSIERKYYYFFMCAWQQYHKKAKYIRTRGKNRRRRSASLQCAQAVTMLQIKYTYSIEFFWGLHKILGILIRAYAHSALL